MRRLVLILAGAPAGLIAGLGAWMAAGGPTSAADKLAPVEAQLSAFRPPVKSAAAGSLIIAGDLVATPLFALSVGPSAVSPPSLRLEGVSLSARRTAALLSIDGKPSQWMTVGETRDGVTLQSVAASRALLDTVLGDVVVALGASAGGGPDPSPLAQATPGAVDSLPPGFRSPPPPASAPRSR